MPAGGTKPEVRIVAHVRTGSRRWIGAAAGGYHDGENTLVDELAGTLRPGMLNPRRPGFFCMDRWIRFSATGAQLCWRVKNGARSVPFKTLPDGSGLVLLHESNGMLAKRRRDAGDKNAPRLPDTVARLIQFTVVTRTRSGRVKASTIGVLTTLLDHDEFPAAGIAALYAQRWQVSRNGTNPSEVKGSASGTRPASWPWRPGTRGGNRTRCRTRTRKPPARPAAAGRGAALPSRARSASGAAARRHPRR